MFGMTANLFTIFLYSYFGAFATTAFFTYGECIYETCWYQLPLVLQKYLIHIIRNGQIEMHYTGNNLFVLNLATFTRVSMHAWWFWWMRMDNNAFHSIFLFSNFVFGYTKVMNMISTFYLMMKAVTLDWIDRQPIRFALTPIPIELANNTTLFGYIIEFTVIWIYW